MTDGKTTTRNTDFCRTFLAAMGRGDYEAQGSMMTPDFRVAEADSLPYAGVYIGIDGWQSLTRSVVRCWSPMKLDLREVIADTGDTMVLRFHLSGTSRKTGRCFETSVVELWRFSGGKLREIVPYYFDTAVLVEADRMDTA